MPGFNEYEIAIYMPWKIEGIRKCREGMDGKRVTNQKNFVLSEWTSPVI
jgi:hypothetical protein